MLAKRGRAAYPECVLAAFVDKYGQVGAQLQANLDRLGEAGIPVDIVYEQGPAVLGLEEGDTQNQPAQDE